MARYADPNGGIDQSVAKIVHEGRLFCYFTELPNWVDTAHPPAVDSMMETEDRLFQAFKAAGTREALVELLGPNPEPMIY